MRSSTVTNAKAGFSARASLVPFAYTAVSMLPVFAVGSLAVTLQRELRFGEAALGLAVSLCFATSALAAVPVGRVVHRVGAASALRLSALVTLAALLCLGTAGSWSQLVLGLVLGGLGSSLAIVSAGAAVALEVPPERYGLGFGIQLAAIPAASVAVGASVPPLVQLAGWHAVFAVAGAVAAVLAMLGAPASAPAHEPAVRHRGVRMTPVLLLIALVAFLAGVVGNSLAAFLVDAAVDRGFSEARGALLLACASIGALASRIGLGWLTDRRRSVGLAELTGLMAAGALAFGLAALAGDDRRVYALAMVLALATSFGWPGLVYCAAVGRSGSHPAPTVGFVMSWTFAGNVIGPLLTGLLVQHWSYTATWIAFGAVMAAGALAAESARRR